MASTLDPTARLRTIELSRPLEGGLSLRVLDGPDRGRSILIDDSTPSPLYLGRSPSCALQLSHPTVSRRHLALEIVEGRVRACDLESRNGSRVGPVAIGQAWLSGGETLHLGATSVVVERLAAHRAPSLSDAARFGRVLGASREMRRIYPALQRIAASEVPVLIEGETGSGKEAVAEAIHEEGGRADGPFVVVDCARLEGRFLELTVLGAEEGAMGAFVAARPGALEEAHGGTLVLDEVGDLSPALQAALCRFLDDGTFVRVGGVAPRVAEARLVATTSRDLDREVQAGRFRDDLFHRLAVARVALPPLRQRKGDVPLLAEAFAAQLGASAVAIPRAVIARWEERAWPGNVRELKNEIVRALELGGIWSADSTASASASVEDSGTRADGVVVAVEDIIRLGLPLAEARRQLVEAFEDRYVEDVLARHDGNVTRAAEASGVARRHFHRLLAKARDVRRG